MRFAAALTTLILVATLAARAASADEKSYRKVIMVTDAIGATSAISSLVLVSVLSSDNIGEGGVYSDTMDAAYASPLFVAGMTTLVLGSPLIHLANGEPVAAGLSVTARIGGPAIGTMVGAHASKDSSSKAIGFCLGGVAALALDYLVLARPRSDNEAPVQLQFGGSF